MFFQISPVIKKKIRKKEVETENEEQIEVLSLAPFTVNPKIAFDNVIVGSTETRKLLIKNSTKQDVHLFIINNVPQELNLVLSWTETSIAKDEGVILELVWSPHIVESCRYSFAVSDGRKINRDVPVTFKSVVPKKTNAAGAKPKLKRSSCTQARSTSPVKLPLVKKYTTPLKKCKQSTRAKSPKKYSPSAAYRGPYENNNIENKENYIYPPKRNRSTKVNQSFRSPVSVTFTLEESEVISERRETFTLQNAYGYSGDLETVHRRDTYVLKPLENREMLSTSDTSVFSDSLEMLSPEPPNPVAEYSTTKTEFVQQASRNFDFEYKLKMMETFNFSPARSPTCLESFQPSVYSSGSKPSSVNNSGQNTPHKVIELFPNKNQTYELVNISGQTFVKSNLSGETYVKSNTSIDNSFKTNISCGTYVKDISNGNSIDLDVSPLSTKTYDNVSPLSSKQKPLDIPYPVVENNVFRNVCESQKQLSSIAEESCLLNESDLSFKVGSKRKLDLHYKASPAKRISLVTEEKHWSKSGTAPFRIAKKSSGINLRKFNKPQSTEEYQISSITEEKTKTVIVTNPFLYAHIIDPFITSSIYCDEEWIQQQEQNFTKWLNALLTPPLELDSEIEGIDIAKVWQECKKREVKVAPSKEHISNEYITNNKINNLRKEAQALFRSEELSKVLQKLYLSIDSGKLSIRSDKDLHLNLKLKSDIMSIILSYNPLWLRIGLETVFNEVIPLRSNSDVTGLINFILDKLFKDAYLLKKHKTIYAPKYIIDLKRSFLKKFLTLVYFLDHAKNQKLIPHDPCLFCKNAVDKESREILLHFSRETLSAVGDITKYLRCLGYVVSHRQEYIHEYDYAVKNLGVDLRDGVRLTKVMEIIQMRDDLTQKMRVPAISRLQKIHNVEVVFKSLQETGYTIMNDISPKDIVDGHREKTLSFLWQIIFKFEAPLMVKSATTIQTWFRSLPVILKRRRLQRIHRQQEEASKKIQIWYKHKKLSEKLFSLSEFVKKIIQEKKMEKAATKIQSQFRMYICRKKYLIHRNSLEKLQAYAKGWLIRHHYRERILSAIIIQKNYHRYCARKKFLELKAATTLIQNKYRALKEMKKAKHSYGELRRSTIFIQRRHRANKLMKIQRETYLSLKHATILIQSCYRMQVIRNYYLQYKKATIIIQRRYRALKAMHNKRSSFLNIRNVTIFIQRKIKAKMIMKRERQKYVTVKSAAITIQTFYRMYVTRRHYLDLKSACTNIQRQYRALKAMKKANLAYTELKEVTIKVQNRFRVNILMKHERKRFLKLKSSVITIQSYYRRHVARKHYVTLKNSVLILQSKYRALKSMKKERSSYQEMKKCVISVQRRFRANQLQISEKKQYEQLRNATVLVQQRYRATKQMRFERQQYQQLRSATIKIQIWYRSIQQMMICQKYYETLKKSVRIIEDRVLATKMMKSEKQHYIKIRQAAVILQQRYRAEVQMKKCRKYFRELKSATVIIQQRYRAKKLMEGEKSYYQNLKLSVTFIQIKYRANRSMKITRKWFLDKKQAALKIQAWFRATVAMRKCRTYFVYLKYAVNIFEERYTAKKLMQNDHKNYQTLKNAAIVLQRRYRAHIEMHKVKKSFIELRASCVFVQRTFRANKLFKIERNRYITFRKAAVTLQRRYRAQTSMHKIRGEFVQLKSAAVIIQQRFRANILMRQKRREYLQLIGAAVVVQQRYRAQKLMIKDYIYYQDLRTKALHIQQKFKANLQGKIERDNYQKLRNAALIVQQLYRARKSMQIVRKNYTDLRKVTVNMQIRFRANLLMKKTRNQYLKTKKAALFIQHWYLAFKAMLKQRDGYRALKKSVLTVQARFRANRLARLERTNYIKLRKSAILVQSRYRARLLMVKEVKNYSLICWAIRVLQSRYRAQKAMQMEMNKYIKLKHATFVIQRRTRAWRLMKEQRDWFLKFRRSIILIQTIYRGYVQMKKDQELFLVKRRSIINIQRLVRGYLIRKKYGCLLTPEAIQKRRIAKIQNAAAIKIQASWRGHRIRNNMDIPEMALLKRKRAKLNYVQKTVPGKTLGQRCELAMQCMINEHSSLLQVIRALEDLDFITRHCRDSCIRMSLILPCQLYIILSAAARSLPEMTACNLATYILINFCKYPPTKPNSWVPEYVDSLINVMLHWCDKEEPLFSSLCTLLWLFAHEKKWKDFILKLPNLSQRILKMGKLVYRKQNMVGKVGNKGSNHISYFASYGIFAVPSRTANWGLDYDRPTRFTNSVYGFNCLKNILDL